MNERIRLLWEEAAKEPYGGTWEEHTAFMGKFAELIVRECIERGNNLANHYINTHSEQEQVMLLASIADYSNEIKKHFGVEE